MEYEKIQSLGVLCLGGVVLTLGEGGRDDASQLVFHATNYRAEQRIASLCFLGQESPSSERAWKLHSVELATNAKEAGRDLFRVVVTPTNAQGRSYQVFNADSVLVASGSFSTLIPSGTRACVSLAPAQQRRWQALFIRSEVELRWFRSILRTRDVRVGLKELDHELRFYAREVEEALQSEDERVLNEALERLRAAQQRIQEETGIAPFPNKRPLALLSES